jgi:lipid A 3-O-deacylase
MKLRNCALGAAMLVAASGPARALDGVAVEIGSGDGTDMARIAIQYDWKQRWLQGANWHLGGYWDLGIGQWHHGATGNQNEDITEIGITPVFRVQPNSLQGFYVEAAIGAHFLSHTSLGERRFSTSFQFGDHVGAGYRFGAKRAYDLSYRYQHLSNGSIKRPNSGINFNQIRLQYHF